MIARVWRGWTRPDDADRYEALLQTEILPAIAARDIDGYRGGEVLRRALDTEVEFMTVLRFVSMADVRRFAGEDVEAAHITAAARRLLIRHDDRARHYERRHHQGPSDRRPSA
ncbi:MAG: antibiotic biosynthesis monooxygenase [Salinibacter sp.]